MRPLMYSRDVRAMPLLLALQAAGVPVLAVRPETDEQGNPRVIVEVEDAADDAAVGTVVAAHDAAAIDAEATQERTRYQQDIANIKTFMAASNTSITHLALVAVVKSIVRVLYRVITDLKD
jgi:hypothetical protein